MGGPIPNPMQEGMVGPPGFVDQSGVTHPHPQPIPFTTEELGYSWPSDRGMFSPAAIPPWLQEQVGVDVVSLLRH
jgi:hypothetical protein